MSDDSLHIVVFPWLAFGHMLPFLELSKSLAKRGHRITYISTPRNIQRLAQMQPNLSSHIQLLSLPLPHVEQLPEGAEATGDVMLDKAQYLKKAFDGLEAPFSAFFKSSCADKSTRPDWVVFDFAHWIPKIANEYQVPCTVFSAYTAPTLVFFGPCSARISDYRTTVEDFTVPPRWVPFPTNVALHLHEARTIFCHCYVENASDITDKARQEVAINGSKFVCIRSCHSLESKWLSVLRETYDKEVVPVGLLPPYVDRSPPQKSSTDVGDGKLDVMDWLDQQPAQSVLYIALGSEPLLSKELLHELALGIEISKVLFLWALKKPASLADCTGILPDGFEERTKEIGLVEGWVPQQRVLAHPSVGGFLTHCGWSSVVESFQFGHPLVQLPLFADQCLNARILEEKQVGVPIPRDKETGDFTREEVAKAIRIVMVEDEGKVFRQNAKQLKEIFADRNAHEKHMDEFVEKLKKFKQDV